MEVRIFPGLASKPPGSGRGILLPILREEFHEVLGGYSQLRIPRLEEHVLRRSSLPPKTALERGYLYEFRRATFHRHGRFMSQEYLDGVGG